MLKLAHIKAGGSEELHKFILFILLTELGSKLIGGEWGGFLWTGFHFFINPIYCLYYLAISFKHLRNIQTGMRRFLFFLSLLVPIAYLIILWKFNIEWVEFFNIKFR